MEELKQNFYKYVTTPIAKMMDAINLPKKNRLKKLHQKLAMDNKAEYIAMTTKLLLEQDLLEHAEQGAFPNPIFFPMLVAKHIDKAEQMFEEKKRNGDFDELNLLIN